MSLVVALGFVSGFILFRRNTIPITPQQPITPRRISVIIPARNEELNLPELLASLSRQTLKPDEVIVVDDHSEDRTREISESFGVTVIASPDLPEGWTGKSWALWNGYLRSSGDVLIFLDADVRLADTALASIVAEQQKQGGAMSVVPYHTTVRFYEQFAMMLNVLGALTFTSPFEQRNPRKGLYGSCIIATREDYERIGGHEQICSKITDDLSLGGRFQEAGIKVTNYLGGRLVSFRMYPGGFRSELEGFAKSAMLSTALLHPLTLACAILWIIGLIVTQVWFLAIGHAALIPLVAGYILYVAEIYYINRLVGRFGIIHQLFPILTVVFFLVVIGYSLYQSHIMKKVIWKGRTIDVGGNPS